jgi:hypothetical protein
MKSVIKLIMCVGMFCGTSFGMENEAAKRRIPLNNDNGQKQERRLQQYTVKHKTDDDAFSDKCVEACEDCCISAVWPVMSAVVLTGLRAYQAIMSDDNAEL